MTKTAGSAPPKKRHMINCEVPGKLHRDLRALSKLDGRTIRWHVENALSAYVAQQSGAR